MLLNLCTQGNVNLPKAEVVLSYTWVGGDRAAFDNNFGYVDGVTGSFNQKRDWDSQAQLGAAYVGAPIIGVTYWFPNDSTNWRKKVKQLALYYWTGTAWVLHTTLTTLPPIQAGPTNDFYDLTGNPMPNPTGKVRIIGKGTSDLNSYRWVTECRFTALV